MRFARYTPSEADRAAAASSKTATATAKGRAALLLPTIRELQAAGVASLAGIAKELTRRGVPTPAGASSWKAVQVGRVLKRA